ncbi:MAG: PEP/pyruvate-binding domain-containing protein [Acidimicrobiales bacterium]
MSNTQALGLSFVDAAALSSDDRTPLLGGKGAALVRMTELGLAVPPGFILSTDACKKFLADGWGDDLETTLVNGIESVATALERRLGDPDAPLLVSVRSGAPVSMPGMMDTVLNAGMSDAIAEALGQRSGDLRFGWDTARRFTQSYALVVCGAPSDTVAEMSRRRLGKNDGVDLSPEALAEASKQLRVDLAEVGYSIPDDPLEQIRGAVQAVFSSWHSDRAVTYRRVEGISDDLATAATIQAMTFGNLDERSGTGVVFTRDPSTGEPCLTGDFLINAQGEDVVAGTHITKSIEEMHTAWPELAGELVTTCEVLERDLGDMADIEFTVEQGSLWLLQVRRGKRSPQAELRIAIDMAEDERFTLDRAGAVERCAAVLADPPVQVGSDAEVDAGNVLCTGLGASPGRAVGQLCTGIEETIERSNRGEAVILIRRETSPADIAGMAEAKGMMTTLGGLVSHAAVVARSWGVPAVVGATGVEVRPEGISIGGQIVPSGEVVTVDGDNGRLLRGAHPGATAEVAEVAVLRRWAEELPASSAEDSSSDDSGSASVDAAAQTTGDSPALDPFEVVRVLALKGMGSAEGIAAVLGTDEASVTKVIADLLASEKAQDFPGGRVRLTPAADPEITAHYETSAKTLGPIIEPMMGDFHEANDTFKSLMAEWQMREIDGETVMNDHTDAAYDGVVIERLRTEIHAKIMPILETIAGADPRFSLYSARLSTALEQVSAGDSKMMAHPLSDSYHTVWFELHEELIRLTGRNRADEAAAGRG